MRKLRVLPFGVGPSTVRRAIAHLRAARALLRKVGAKRSADRVRAAIRSADGALRHVERIHYAKGVPMA